MKEIRMIMGMPVVVEIADEQADEKIFTEVFEYFTYVDEKFSTYKETSEISAINRGGLDIKKCSEDMRTIFALSEDTKKHTNGYFDIRRKDGSYDPSGIVKGWAIFNAAKLILSRGFKNFYINVAGDIQAHGHTGDGHLWKVGIQNPFTKKEQSVKTLYIENRGVATSGTSVRGNHIYNPKRDFENADEIISMTIVASDVYEADRFATAAFAMGKAGISFIENLEGFEGYMIDLEGIATMTSGFNRYTEKL